MIKKKNYWKDRNKKLTELRETQRMRLRKLGPREEEQLQKLRLHFRVGLVRMALLAPCLLDFPLFCWYAIDAKN